MELFAFRTSGLNIVNDLTTDPKTIIYLFDAPFSASPLNYVSNMFLATAVYNRFFFPQVHILSRVDLLPQKEIERINDWRLEEGGLENAIEIELSGTNRILSREMIQLFYCIGLNF